MLNGTLKVLTKSANNWIRHINGFKILNFKGFYLENNYLDI